MFKMRSRSKNKAVLGGSAEEEAALDDDEDKGLEFTVKEDAEVCKQEIPVTLFVIFKPMTKLDCCHPKKS